MGRNKKKNKSKEAEREAEEWDGGGLSRSSSASSLLAVFESADSTGDGVLEHLADMLTEKRGSTRDKALKLLAEYLRSNFRQEECWPWKDTLLHAITEVLKRGKSQELATAAMCTTLLVLTIGADEWTEQMAREVFPHMERLALKSSSPSAVAACARCLSFLCFVASDGEAVTLAGGIAVLRKLTAHTAADVRAEAFNGLGLIFSISGGLDREIRKQGLQGYLKMFSKALADAEVKVRTAAGSALVVFAEVHGELMRAEEASEGEEEGGEGEGLGMENGTRGHGAGLQECSSLVDKMAELATSSWHDQATGQRLNKRDKSEQREVFRNLLGVLEGDPRQESKIKLQHGDVLVLETHGSRLIASCLKLALSSGFQAHMQRNTLLHEVFEYSPREARVRLSGVEKRLLLSPNSQAKKAQTQERQRMRRNRHSAVNLESFMEGE